MSLSSGFKRYTKNTGHLFLSKIVRSIVALAVWAVVIRYLGPEQFGLFSYALSFVFLFSILSDLGLEAIAVRDLVKIPAQRDVIIGSVFFLKFAGAALSIFAIILTTKALSLAHSTRVVILIMSIRLVFKSLNSIDFYFQSRVLSKYTVYSQLFGLLATSVLCLTFVKLKMPLVYFIYVVVIEDVVIAVGLVVFYKIIGQRLSLWQFNLSMIKKLIKDSWPMIFSGFAVSIYMRIDQLMIKQILGIEATGYYSAAVRISEVFYFIPIAITASLFPAIINARQKSRSLYYSRLEALFSFLFWLALSIAVAVAILAPFLMQILFGSKYLQSAGALTIHIWTGIFVFLGVARTKWAINENLQKHIMVYLLSGAVLNVLLNLILIPAGGIKGAAIATLISQAWAAVFSSLISRATRLIFKLQLKALNLFKAFKVLNF